MGAALEHALELSRRESLFRRTRSVLAAVSGGPDSVALLLVLESLAAQGGFALTAAHFDHMLRPGSRSDLEWVRQLCANRAIPFLSGEGDVAETARRQRLGIEETARRMRYQFLSFVAGEKGIDAIATGHTADDQAETVLMRVIRGSGVRGIRGMLPAATVPGGSQRLVRPLLETPRAVTQAICAEAGIEPLNDESNSDTAMLRNRLRQEVIPVLQSVNPSVTDALRRLADNAREVFEGVERRAMSVQPEFRGPQGAVYALQHVRPLESEGLVLVIEREAAFFRLEAERNATRLRNLADVLRAGHGSVEFGRAEVEVSSGRVRIGPRLEYTAVAAKVLNVPGSTLSGPWRVDVSTSEFPGGGPEARGAVPIDGLSGALRVRSPEPGDRMLYGKIDRKVSDILSNARVPAWDRRAAIAIADGRRVLAVLTADGTFEADLEPGADVVHVRVATAPART